MYSEKVPELVSTTGSIRDRALEARIEHILQLEQEGQQKILDKIFEVLGIRPVAKSCKLTDWNVSILVLEELPQICWGIEINNNDRITVEYLIAFGRDPDTNRFFIPVSRIRIQSWSDLGELLYKIESQQE
jgi:hypothetical protein